MDSVDSVTYQLGGIGFNVLFNDPIIGVICEAFFGQYRCDGITPPEYDIIFKKIDERHLDILKIKASTSSNKNNLNMVNLNDCCIFYRPLMNILVCFYSSNTIRQESINEKDPGLEARYLFYDGSLPKNATNIRSLFFWFLEQLGIFRLHAAFVEYGGRDILFVGKGSMGKTTSAINTALNGGKIYCDDSIFFREGTEGMIEIFPEIRPLSVTLETLALFPEIPTLEVLEQRIGNSLYCKDSSFVQKDISVSGVRRGVPEILIFPSILDKEINTPRIVKNSAYDAFIALLDNDISIPPIANKDRKKQLDLIEILTNQVEIYSLSSSQDMDANIKLLEKVFT